LILKCLAIGASRFYGKFVKAWLHVRFLFPADFSRRNGAKTNQPGGP
jgi:hypothetical protein